MKDSSGTNHKPGKQGLAHNICDMVTPALLTPHTAQSLSNLHVYVRILLLCTLTKMEERQTREFSEHTFSTISMYFKHAKEI